jgi:hypothetical protein
MKADKLKVVGMRLTGQTTGVLNDSWLIQRKTEEVS